MSNSDNFESSNIVEQKSSAQKIKALFFLAAKAATVGYMAYWFYGAYREQQEELTIDAKAMSDLQAKASKGDVEAIILLAKKMKDGYYGPDGNTVTDMGKAIELLKQASALGSAKAKEILALYESQKEEADLASENKARIIAFATGDWIEQEYGLKFSIDKSGKVSVNNATAQELNPEYYQREKQIHDMQRDAKYSEIRENNGIIASFKERVSDVTSDKVNSTTQSVINSAAGMYLNSQVMSGLEQKFGYVADLENKAKYSQIKSKFSNSIFYSFDCTQNSNCSKTKLWIATSNSSGGNAWEVFDCEEQDCVAGGSNLTRLDLSTIREIPKKAEPTKKPPQPQMGTHGENTIAKASIESKTNVSAFVIPLPFIGTKTFNFEGGSGTAQSITITKDGNAVIKLHGNASPEVIFKGKYSNKLSGSNGNGWLLENGKIYLINNLGEIVKGCREEEAPCESELLEVSS